MRLSGSTRPVPACSIPLPWPRSLRTPGTPRGTWLPVPSVAAWHTGTPARRVLRRAVPGRKRDAQAPAREHHDHLCGTGALGEILRMSDESDAAVVDAALVHGCSRERSELASLAACNCAVDERNHVRRLPRITRSCPT